MYKLNLGAAEALRKAKEYFDFSKRSSLRQIWLERHRKAVTYYAGQQWGFTSERDKSLMDDIGLNRYTYNIIKANIDNLTSMQIRSSKRVVYEATTDNLQHKEIANQLKALAYDIQTKSDHIFASSRKFTSALVSGIGWSITEVVGDNISYAYVPPEEVYFDPSDTSLDFSQSRFVCRTKMVDSLDLSLLYPSLAKEFEQMVSNPSSLDSLGFAGEFDDDSSLVNGFSIRVVDVYYKKLVDAYSAEIIPEFEGNDVESPVEYISFDKGDLLQRVSESEIKKIKATQIWHCRYVGDLLLFHDKLENQVPNQSTFPLSAVVLIRDPGYVPYGLVENVYDIQDNRNYLWSTVLHYLDSKTVTVTDPEVDRDKARFELGTEIRKKNAVLFARERGGLTIHDHVQDTLSRKNLLDANAREMEMILGVYGEYRGEETNVISGVAIKAKTQNTQNAHNYEILAYETMILNEGRVLLDILKGSKDLNFSFKQMQKGVDTIVSLDKKISILDFNIYARLSSIFSSSAEESAQKFADLMQNPHKDYILANPEFLMKFGFDEKEAYNLHQEHMKTLALLSGQANQESEEEVE